VGEPALVVKFTVACELEFAEGYKEGDRNVYLFLRVLSITLD